MAALGVAQLQRAARTWALTSCPQCSPRGPPPRRCPGRARLVGLPRWLKLTCWACHLRALAAAGEPCVALCTQKCLAVGLHHVLRDFLRTEL